MVIGIHCSINWRLEVFLVGSLGNEDGLWQGLNLSIKMFESKRPSVVLELSVETYTLLLLPMQCHNY